MQPSGGKDNLLSSANRCRGTTGIGSTTLLDDHALSVVSCGELHPVYSVPCEEMEVRSGRNGVKVSCPSIGSRLRSWVLEGRDPENSMRLAGGVLDSWLNSQLEPGFPLDLCRPVSVPNQGLMATADQGTDLLCPGHCQGG
jgi:hypothetical protein